MRASNDATPIDGTAPIELTLDGHGRLPPYTADDVSANTTMFELVTSITAWLSYNGVSLPVGAQVALVTESGEELELNATAADTDLFNRARSVVITLAGSSSVWTQRHNASQSAYNTRPAAPEHLGMVNPSRSLTWL